MNAGRKCRFLRAPVTGVDLRFHPPTARMAEPEPPPRRHSPLDGVLPWSLPDGAVTLSELRFAEQIGLRLKPPVPAYLEGVPLPLTPNRVANMGALRSCGSAPTNGSSRLRAVSRRI